MQIKSTLSKSFILIVLAPFLIVQFSRVCHGVKDPSIPEKFRSEGRIILDYTHNGRTDQHQLVFKEISDLKSKRSKVSIGYISRDPRNYIARNKRILLIKPDGACEERDSHVWAWLNFAPEINWFIQAAFEQDRIEGFLEQFPHYIGPTGLLAMVLLEAKDQSYEQSSSTHRNIPCTVFTKHFSRSRGTSIGLELYVPVSHWKSDSDSYTLFSVKRTANGMTDAGDGSKIDLSFTIDYFYIESLTDDHLMEHDFDLATGVGCSSFLPKIQPNFASKSLYMQYRHISSVDAQTIFYDQARGYLRSESGGVRIWDINQGLMYNIAQNIVLGEFYESPERGDLCSIMNVGDDTSLHSSLRPFKSVKEPLSIAQLLGAQLIVYIGRSEIRGMPCIVFESIHVEPPIIFGLTSSDKLQQPNDLETSYVVQYHVLHPKQNDPEHIIQEFSQTSEKEFWPALISLYEKNSDGIREVESLEIYDFYFHLYGIERSIEIFMAPECFDDDNEFTTIEMTMLFESDDNREHLDSSDYNRMMARDKYKLEFDLMNQLSTDLRINLIHLVEFQLNLRPHHVALDLMIGGREKRKTLSYFGKVKKQTNYGQNLITRNGLSETVCVSDGSFIRDALLIVWCPSLYNMMQQSECIIVFGEKGPDIESYEGTNDLTCQAYTLKSDNTQPADYEWDTRKKKLIDWSYEYKAIDSNREITLTGKVLDVDVRHSVLIHYLEGKDFKIGEAIDTTKGAEDHDSSTQTTTFEQHTGLVRSFPEMAYSSPADCLKMCNLDADCRSYSYCAKTKKCLIASLDINKSTISGLEVTDHWSKQQYSLVNDPNCNIFGRDYIDAFRQTGEQVQIDKALSRQMEKQKSASHCAMRASDVEAINKNYHVASFLYCPTTETCILDEDLFNSSSTTTEERNTSEKDEIRCIMYRRKYQNYFHVSPKILVKSDKIHQLDLVYKTVEECAQACWNQFGKICSSFDYCLDKNKCLINQLGESGEKKPEVELKPNCLHYERDLKLDQLRKEHLIGQHSFFGGESGEQRTSTTSIVIIILLVLASGSFVFGLFIGGRMNSRILAIIGSPNIPHRSNNNTNSTGKRLSRALLNWNAFAKRFGGSRQWSQPIIDQIDPASTIVVDVTTGENSNAGDVDLDYDSGNTMQMDVIKGTSNEAYIDKD